MHDAAHGGSSGVAPKAPAAGAAFGEEIMDAAAAAAGAAAGGAGGGGAIHPAANWDPRAVPPLIADMDVIADGGAAGGSAGTAGAAAAAAPGTAIVDNGTPVAADGYQAAPVSSAISANDANAPLAGAVPGAAANDSFTAAAAAGAAAPAPVGAESGAGATAAAAAAGSAAAPSGGARLHLWLQHPAGWKQECGLASNAAAAQAGAAAEAHVECLRRQGRVAFAKVHLEIGYHALASSLCPGVVRVCFTL